MKDVRDVHCHKDDLVFCFVPHGSSDEVGRRNLGNTLEKLDLSVAGWRTASAGGFGIGESFARRMDLASGSDSVRASISISRSRRAPMK